MGTIFKVQEAQAVMLQAREIVFRSIEFIVWV